jgi:acetyl esterase/lipase
MLSDQVIFLNPNTSSNITTIMAAKIEINPITGFPDLTKIEDAAVSALPPADPSIEELSLDIALQSGFTSHVLIARPKPTTTTTTTKKYPLIVLFHGGGFLAGSPRSLIPPMRAYAAQFHAVVASCSYPLMPTHAFPASTSAGWAVLCELARRSESLGADLQTGFVVGGVSAGATVAAVCAERAVFGWEAEDAEWAGVDAGEKLVGRITGLWLGCPYLFVPGNIPERFKDGWNSRVENATVEGLNLAGLTTVEKFLALDETTAKSGLWSGANVLDRTAKSEVEKLEYPPVYIHVGQHDPLRDDGIVFEKILKEKGVKTMLQLHKDDVHVSWTIMPFPRKSKNPTVEESSLDGMKWLLNL